MTKPSPLSFIVASAVFGAALFNLGCSSSSTPGATFPSGEIIGPPDSHCAGPDGGLTIQTIGVCQVIDPARVPSNQSTCGVTFSEDGGTGAAAPPDASTTSDDAGAPTSDYRPTMYGSAGNDDDCKYYVSWIATPIQEKADTYFTVTVIRLQDMKPATCAGVIPDVFLDPVGGGIPTHGLPATPPAPEIMPGVYKVGPLRFDKSGTWTARFHFFEECTDSNDSPHGHAAFFVNVP